MQQHRAQSRLTGADLAWLGLQAQACVSSEYEILKLVQRRIENRSAMRAARRQRRRILATVGAR